MADLKDKFRGSLLWSAVGDAIGSSSEFRSTYNIRSEFDRQFEEHGPEKAIQILMSIRGVTDDTMMTRYQTASIVKSGGFNTENTAEHFGAWLKSGELRGIGKTTREALSRLNNGVHWRKSGKTGDQAAGNGCAMRIAPVALMYHDKPEDLFHFCKNASKITHNCDEAFAGTRAVAFAIASAILDVDPKTIPLNAAKFAGPSVTADKLKEAHNMLEKNVHAIDALSKLGCGGYVAETAASAIYCFASTPGDPVSAILSSILAGGDTDTTAAVVGAISGARNGAEQIPQAWLNTLGLDDGFASADDIRGSADDLYSVWCNRISIRET